MVLRVISRSGTADDVGLYFFAQAIATPVAFLAGIRLRDQLATRSNAGRLSDYLPRLALTTGIAISATAPWWFLFSTNKVALAGVGVLWANLAQAYVWAAQGTLLRQGKLMSANTIDVAMGITAVLSAVAGYSLLGGLHGVGVLLGASWSLLAIVTIVFAMARDEAMSKPLPALRDDILMGLGAMGGVGQITSARVGAAALLGNTALAQIGSASFLVRASLPVVNGSVRILFPKLAAAHSLSATHVLKLEARIRRALWIFVPAGSLTGATVGFFIGPQIVGILFSTSVAPSSETAAIVLGAAPSLYASMVYAQLLVARRLGRSTTAMSLWSIAATIIAVVPLSLGFGTPGAALALGLGYLVRTIAAERELRKASSGTQPS